MAHSRATPSQSGRGATASAGRRSRAAPGVKLVLFGLVVAALVAFVGVALVRELSEANQANARTASARPVVSTPRPALSPDEEGYAQALWPIHNEVKLGALRMTMAGIQYKTNRIDAAALKSQVEASVGMYRQAEQQMLELRPPPSFQAYHDEYFRAVRLYQQAGAEMARLYDDQSEEHLVTAFPMSQEGGRILRRVGAVLWPNEYVPS